MIFKYRVKGSSLVEVTTAMIIISMIFGFAIITYLNLQRTNYSSKKLTYQMLLDEMPVDADYANQGAELEKMYENVSVHRTATRHPSNPELYIVHIEVRSTEGKLLAERKYLRYAPKN